MGRVIFSAKNEPQKAEPTTDWSRIESRLKEISSPPPSIDLSHDPSVAGESSVTLARDPVFIDELCPTGLPARNSVDALKEMLSQAKASFCDHHIKPNPDFQIAQQALASEQFEATGAIKRIQTGSN